MFNGGRLNATPLNGVRRQAVLLLSAALLATFGADLVSQRTVVPSASAAVNVTATFAPSAKRFTGSTAQFGTTALLAPCVARSGHGAIPFSLGASLYYTRTQLLFGGAELTLRAFGDVGIVFIGGGAPILPMQVELSPTRAKRIAGTAITAPVAQLDASAIRRPAAAAVVRAEIDAALDPAHIADGVRYITADLRAPVSLLAEDDGMRRQVSVGSGEFRLFADGRGVVRRPTLAGVGHIALTVGHEWNVQRRAAGSAALGLSLQGDAEILVQGSGAASFSVSAQGFGTVYKRTAQGAAVVAVGSALTPLRAVRVASSAPLVLSGGATGLRYACGQGRPELPLVLSSFSPVVYRVPTGILPFGMNVDGNATRVVVPTGACIATVVVSADFVRHVFLRGDAALAVAATCSGQVLVPGAGDAAITVAATCSGQVLVPAAGDAALAVAATCSGEIFVRGFGAAALVVSASGDGEVFVPGSGAAVVALASALSITRFRAFDGSVPLVVQPEGRFTRFRHGDGTAQIELLQPSEGYTNIFAEDPTEQTFKRPAETRVFFRPEETRSFWRQVA